MAKKHLNACFLLAVRTRERRSLSYTGYSGHLAAPAVKPKFWTKLSISAVRSLYSTVSLGTLYFSPLLQGNDIRLVHYPNESMSINSIPIHEDSWMREDGLMVDREHLLMALADLDFILVQATETLSSVALSNIR